MRHLVVAQIANLRYAGDRAPLLALSLIFFPGGLNPVSSMMIIPLIETRNEIPLMVAVLWFAAGLDILAGGFGGAYLVIVLVALALGRRHVQRKPLPAQSADARLDDKGPA